MENTNPMQTPKEQPKKGGKWKLIVGVLVAVVVVGAVVLGAQGGLFQGKLFRFKAPVVYDAPVAYEIPVAYEPEDEPEPEEPADEPTDEPTDEPADEPTQPAVNDGHLTVSLSSSSPSGSRTVSMDDTIASFDLCAVDGHVTVNGMEYLLTGDRDNMMTVIDKDPLNEINDHVAMTYVRWLSLSGNPTPHAYVTKVFTDSINFEPNYTHFSIVQGTCVQIDLDINTQDLINMTVNDEDLSVSLENVTVDAPAVVDTAFPVAGNTLSY
ncbi:MAG: hypothetical protein ABID64_02165 [Nitrospirota bacterium]